MISRFPLPLPPGSRLRSLRRLPCAHDQNPEHERDFSQPERCAEGEGFILISWEEEAGKAESEIAEAAHHQPYAKEARDESRSVHEQPERNQPYAPEDCVGEVQDVMELQEQHDEGVVLRLVED